MIYTSSVKLKLLMYVHVICLSFTQIVSYSCTDVVNDKWVLFSTGHVGVVDLLVFRDDRTCSFIVAFLHS